MIFQAGEVENSGILKKVQMIYVFFAILSLKYRELPGYIGIGMEWNDISPNQSFAKFPWLPQSTTGVD